MKVRASLPAAFAFLLVAGFAAAMPMASFDADGDPAAVLEPEVTEAEESESEDSEGPHEDQDETSDPSGPEGADLGKQERPENHGSAVSTAAKCGIRGRAHGELVRSVAKDKSATVDSATAACEAALAAQAEAAPASAKAPKAPKPERGTATTDSEGKVKGGRPDHAGPKKSN